MPTYKNESPQQHTLELWNGSLQVVCPGETVQTRKFYDLADVTKLSDEPLYNRVVARHSAVEASDEGTDVSISLDTARVLIERITGTITVYRQSTSNTPAELADRTSKDLISIFPANALFDNLVVVGSGTCDVVEYAE